MQSELPSCHPLEAFERPKDHHAEYLCANPLRLGIQLASKPDDPRPPPMIPRLITHSANRAETGVPMGSWQRACKKRTGCARAKQCHPRPCPHSESPAPHTHRSSRRCQQLQRDMIMRSWQTDETQPMRPKFVINLAQAPMPAWCSCLNACPGSPDS